ncbi:MAG: diadenylate cyclase CdaA [Dysgonamonadaceae bacterium]|jgi:uncharacterized protein (TIGR00159 family)|nr:diadenylate cyclase CdaA [Dysgonamonadaceae bacterium]
MIFAIALANIFSIVFADIQLRDVIDVLLVAFFLYETHLLMKKTGTTTIFLGVLAFIAIWVLVSHVFKLKLMGAILDKFISVGFILLVIVFQKEMREFLQALGSNRGFGFIKKLLSAKDGGSVKNRQSVMPVVMAVMDMAKRKEGALIAFQRDIPLEKYIETGEILNADVSTRLIESIFFKNSPLHDGAMIIAGVKIKAVGCILPVAQNQDIPKHLGLRHRSALGLAQETDAIVIVVSEESGHISLTHNGNLRLNITADDLQKELTIE